ncbi:hypothetical protein BJY01DRAFT_204129 [Aspergillus pseudoustus]|uniref:F-box domain-containing protein n=1 Tax=Aspergillus pseudoustus TaxID=1810923 RepID=A0ABR4KW15_9EURO
MPNPADLPPEIFTLILSYALKEDVEVRDLLSLSFLSRAWYTSLIPRIYSSWTYNGARQPFATLYKFLLTILRDPQLADEVSTLRIGNWGFFPGAAAPAPELQVPDEELELIRSAIRNAGVGHLEEDILGSLRKRDRRPLMALLLVTLPNLRAVWAHVPRRDPILGAVLKRVVDAGHLSLAPALANLSELHLCQESPVRPPWVDSDSEDEDEDYDEAYSENWDSLRLTYLWPIFYHDSLRTLSLIDLETKKASTWLPAPEDGASNLSHIEHLHLVTIWKSLCTYADIHSLTSQPRALKSFTLSLHDNPYDRRRNEIISNAELWGSLQQHQDTLEFLDICRSKNTHRDGNGRFGLLRPSFQKLKHLAIQTEIILGGCCGEPRASFRLKDTLPSSIQSLTLYGDEGFALHTDLAAQLRELVTGDDFPHLISIILDDSHVLYTDDGTNIKPAYQGLVNACKARNVSFRVEESSSTLGGLGCYQRLWGKALYMQADGATRDAAASYSRKRLRDPVELLLKDDGWGDERIKFRDNDDDEDDGRLAAISVSGSEPGVFHTIPFEDHTGQTAYMVFRNAASIPLPPLFAFAVYFTHPRATPKSANMQSLCEAITPPLPSFRHIRFDMYFLPDATTEDCVAHYTVEKKVRGSSKDQIRVFKTLPPERDDPLPAGQMKIPGMVKKYLNLDHDHRSLLFLSPTESWQDGTGMLCVTFEQKQRGPASSANANNASANSSPPIHATLCPLNQEDPSYDFTSREGPHPISDAVYDAAHVDREMYMGPWVEAGRKGWTAWR